MTNSGDTNNNNNNNNPPRRVVFVLHGSRQTGDLLLGRMDKLRKRLEKQLHVQLVAPTASFPHPQDAEMRHWWNWERGTDAYHGFADVTVPQLQQLWKDTPTAVGFLGFSQGARLAHLLNLLHERHPEQYFTGLRFVMMVAGYDAPLPEGRIMKQLSSSHPFLVTRSLHVWGEADALITPSQSQANAAMYQNPVLYVHEGGHHLPMRAAAVRAYVEFIQQALQEEEEEIVVEETKSPPEPVEADEETKQAQRDEVEAMMAIFPDEFQLLSEVITTDDDENDYTFPIRYQISLDATDQGVWPPRPLQLSVTYPPTYPQSAGPLLELIHQNNVLEFSTAQRDACWAVMQEAALAEEGMPCVYACYAAAKEFFESGTMAQVVVTNKTVVSGTTMDRQTTTETEDTQTETTVASSATTSSIRTCSAERIQQCNQQGLDIAASILKSLGAVRGIHRNASADDGADNLQNQMNRFKGGSWTYTIGLVGKPSAGKSTFFNAATAFARQRDDADNLLGGAR